MQSEPIKPGPAIDQKLVVAEEAPLGILPELQLLLERTRREPVVDCLELLRWKYLQNPDGTAVVWTLRRGDSGMLVGFTACVPRRVWVNGRIVTAWNGADFSVDEDYRTLGPAVILRRQARLQVDVGRADFLYAHPNAKMAVVHRRVGHFPLGRMVRLARLLTLKSKLPQRTGLRWVQPLADWVVGPALRAASRGFRRGAGDVQILDPLTFDARFDELFERQTQFRSIVGVRDSRYLNWRWGMPCANSPTILVAPEEGGIGGYLVLAERRGRWEIRDLFPASNPELAVRLIRAAVNLGIDRGFPSISVTLLEKNPLIEIFRRCWFFLRDDTSESFVYAKEDFRRECSLDAPDSWFMLSGDRDV